MDRIRWWTISEYVDTETGEMITKSEVERNYDKIKYTKKNELKDEVGRDGIIRRNGYKTYTWECRRKRQYRLEI